MHRGRRADNRLSLHGQSTPPLRTDQPRLLGITKRGNKYLRKLLIHGARAALPWIANSATYLGQWLRALLARTHKNTAVVALANKLARIAWAVLRRGGFSALPTQRRTHELIQSVPA